jgi:hypothetical protein
MGAGRARARREIIVGIVLYPNDILEPGPRRYSGQLKVSNVAIPEESDRCPARSLHVGHASPKACGEK